MSIAIALLGQNCGVVATDSQITGNIGNIVSSNFNKTFPLFNGLVAVAQTGIMDISGIYVNSVIPNFFLGQPNPTAFGKVINTIKTGLTNWLIQNYLSIPAGLNRGVELLLVGRDKISSGIYKIYTIEFNERNINMGNYVAVSRSFSGYGASAASGDTNARAAINSMLSKPTFSNFNGNQLINFADGLIKIGINNSGSLSNFPNTKSCGGVPLKLGV